MKTLSDLLPVIHYRDLDTALKNAEIAASCDCLGVFLIHMQGLDHMLDAAVPEIRQRFPSLKIGINRLSTPLVPSIARNIELGADYTWSDNCGVSSAKVDRVGFRAAEVMADRPQHRLFGSIAFKYQAHEPNPPLAAAKAYGLGFIPTTSGSGTGSAPDVAKIVGMAGALEDKVLAVASGITPENVDPFIPHVRYFLVATGISKNEFEFDQERVAQLAAKLK